MSFRKGKLIVFAGIDGSGKTTAAQWLAVKLRCNDIDAEYIYGRFYPRLVLPIMWIGRKLFTKKISKNNHYIFYSESKKQAMSKMRFLKYPYYFLLLLDIFIQLNFRFGIKLLSGKTVVTDRYFYDALVNFMVNLSVTPEATAKMIFPVRKLFPKPIIYFLIDVPESVSVNRKCDVPSIHYLKERRYLYYALGERLGMIMLNGAGSREEIRKRVLLVLKNKIDNVCI